MSPWWLTAAIFLPAMSAIIIALWPHISARLVRYFAVCSTTLTLAISLVLFFSFDRLTTAPFQFETLVPWIAEIGVSYHVGLDGLSLILVVLTALLGFLAVLISWKIDLRVREYFAWLLLLETSILGVFSSLDLVLFYVFWEIEVIPMYFLISIWGSGRRQYSAIKYVIYTLFGGVLILVGILSLYFSAGTFDLVTLAESDLGQLGQALPATAVFFLILTGFAVKLPVFPLHTWLPDAHTDAPTAVSVMLAGALIKMGGYGMIRLSVSLFPELADEWSGLLMALAATSVVYGAAVTLRQTDIKRLIAYSSISHMGYVLLGIFALSEISLVGAGMQMFSHGIIAALLFALSGVVMHNAGERNLSRLGGLAAQMPLVATFFIIGGLGAMGVPATSGFISEFLTFVGAFSVDGARVYTIICLLGILLAAGYMLWLIERAFWGPAQERFASTKDADPRELAVAVILSALIIAIGVYPYPLTELLEGALAPLALSG